MAVSEPTPSPSAGGHSPLGRSSLNLPNAITVLRLILSIILFILIEMGQLWLICALLFSVAAFTDFLDGYLARKYGQVTVLGRILDPFVDKIIVCGTFIFLQNRSVGGLESGIAAWMTFVVIAREMYVTSLRAVMEQRGVDFSAQWSGKIKMVVQSIALPACLLTLSPVLHGWLEEQGLWSGFVVLRDVLLWATVAITLYSGAEYTVRGARLLRGEG
ncbi:CDP-diacylglycerol--glycerol-3-phosphate 3-phosphatidyltransferase [Maioricimonas rarisocia]|uniref:CDP-diacylglycerol--glycerol-3-phosphate 3-phosphatidyltransferase n=1 Tax=Maioricimonas rarisocia TaxID=2528026 RepID=A0A517ZBK9_9PLAN|nr:CDP-diacylglycerol--glycerol-3-phosphate 3-phosphatidyltransferase [Maioricimonas rarisocia]QDU39885.1 CDP-diacylglycerol--glycerol-3-phosphate 3-phosphatidyltransferase [Maioricimonas rarisocia]